jgi:hypothetical protein
MNSLDTWKKSLAQSFFVRPNNVLQVIYFHRSPQHQKKIQSDHRHVQVATFYTSIQILPHSEAEQAHNIYSCLHKI